VAVWRWLAACPRGVLVGAVLIALLVGLAIARPGGDPNSLDVEHGLSELGAPLAPSADAPLGTDQLGRDVLARVAAGARTSLAVATLATLLALAIGVAVGLAAGYAGGWLDNLLMRTVDLVLAIPVLLLAILLAALLRESGLASSNGPVVLTLAIAGWPPIARVVRSKTLALAHGELVVAARSLGAPPLRIVLRHLLPNVAGIVIAIGVIAFAQNLLAEAVLSYLGLGPPPPAPTWGRMLYEGRVFYRTSPHLVIVPGVAILVAVASFHLLGEGLRDRIAGSVGVRSTPEGGAKSE
jgi:peptide/nickel transport system permease protein